MKKFFLFICLVMFCGCAENETAAGKTGYDLEIDSVNETVAEEITFNGKKYSLTFDDEFSSDTMDTTRWSYSPEMVRQGKNGWGGWWKNKCSSFKDGNYISTCTIDDKGTPVSGAIQTNGKFEQAFGLYHIRFKVEKAYGLWYAFWLLCDSMGNDLTGDGSAKDGAELDIFEVVPGADRENNLADFGMSVHWDGYDEKNLKSASDFTHPLGDDFYGKYHEVWYLWDKDGYKFYMDGTGEENLIFDFPAEQYGKEACEEPCYMILSAEYGIWGGEINSKMLPAHFYVDYVRVYEEASE
ncbi:MAG: glycoside hydrolase family 16 protein [Treponema sp.]|nr:glycoside hydrolase family 16 protein [Treponema sp.]